MAIHKMTFRLDTLTAARINALSRDLGKTKSAIVREAVSVYARTRGKVTEEERIERSGCSGSLWERSLRALGTKSMRSCASFGWRGGVVAAEPPSNRDSSGPGPRWRGSQRGRYFFGYIATTV